jgi:hypothetical protein
MQVQDFTTVEIVPAARFVLEIVIQLVSLCLQASDDGFITSITHSYIDGSLITNHRW